MTMCYSGVLYWNMQHHWWTFQHLLCLTAKAPGTPIKRLFDFIGSQAFLVTPWLLTVGVGLAVGTLREKREAVKNEVSLFLACMGIPSIVFFCLLALKSKVQGNWMPNAWLSLSVLAACWLTDKFLNIYENVTAKRHIVAIACFSLFLNAVMLSADVRLALRIKLAPDQDLSNTTYGWRQMAKAVQDVRDEMGAESNTPVFLSANGYQFCALLNFYLPDHPKTHLLFLHNRLAQYAVDVEELKGKIGHDSIYVDDGQADSYDMDQIFDNVIWYDALLIMKKPYYKEPIRKIYIARCRNYNKYIGLDWAKGG